jgi:uncharacterized Tic20 family protein
MRDTPIYSIKDRNPVTRAAHKRQVLWQITVPFVAGILVILALAALTVASALGGGAVVSRWADISLIWLILPTMIFTLIFLIVVSALVYFVVKVIGVLPEYAYKAQEFLAKMRARLQAASDTAASPVIKTGGFFAALRVLFGK